ncbi:MAG: Carboxypeptidase regulatory-like domain [Geminicoccaceae bacterium]|nr:Carboxypeptidase regulatory-like domain [Geminicoccaceae bacterium]
MTLRLAILVSIIAGAGCAETQSPTAPGAQVAPLEGASGVRTSGVEAGADTPHGDTVSPGTKRVMEPAATGPASSCISLWMSLANDNGRVWRMGHIRPGPPVLASLMRCLARHTPTPEAPPPGPPTVPPDPPSVGVFLWGMVVDDSGVCIPGATVRVVAGQRLGASVVQRTPCDAWAYEGGFTFEHVTAGVAMTLLASAPGYVDAEATVVPSLGPQRALLITPSRELPADG